MLETELDILRKNPETISSYSSGMSLLFRSGVFQYLRAMGRVLLSPKDTQESIALNGAYAAGWQDCLDILLNFKEQVYDKRAIPKNIRVDYGGFRAALQRGDLTEEDRNAIINGK